jgi:hypothetical protein
MKALVSLIAVLGSGAAVTAGPCAPKVYTLDADFDAGVMFNVNHNAPNGDQLQLNDSGGIQTLPVMYIANAGEDTVSKIDTNTNKEVARYRTWFGPSGQPGWAGDHDAWSGPAPSRSAVDDNGNAFVGNREFRSGKRATLVKILKTDYVDRNGNGVMDTSTDANNNGVIDASEIKAWGDTNTDGLIQDSEIGDERIAWIVEVGPANGIARSVSIAPNGNIWVGYWNSQLYTEHSPATGAQVSGPWATPGHSPYGSLVDANGILWGSGWVSYYLLRLNTATGAFTFAPDRPQIYGIAIGTDPASPTTTRVYMAYARPPYYQYTDGGSFADPSAETFSSYGISVDAGGNILVSGSSYSSTYGCSKFNPAGTTLWNSNPQTGATGGDQRGAIVDSNGDVWTVNRANDNVSKFRGTDGAHLGVLPVGLQPYTYSDASGSSFLQTNPTGTWEVVYDAGELGARNCVFSWTSQESNGSSLEVKVDASDTKTTVGDFNPNTAVIASNGVQVPVIAGRYVYVRVKFTAANQTSPILKDLTIKTCPQRGDLNDDCCIDRTDLNLVMAHIRARLPYNAALDVNLDGVVDISDARQIVLWFCFPLGAPCPSA